MVEWSLNQRNKSISHWTAVNSQPSFRGLFDTLSGHPVKFKVCTHRRIVLSEDGMKIHEYQAKQILARYNVRIPRGEVAYTKEEAREIAERIGGTVVVKAQIHAGGRGKGGGVKVVKTADDAADTAGRMLGMNLVTAQTGPEGRQVQKVLIEEGL